MKIGLDFDGVISDCSELKHRTAKELFGVDIPAGDFKKEIVVGKGLLSLKDYREVQKCIYHNRDIGLTMIEVPGSIDGIKTLLKSHEVIIVTSRGKEEAAIAEEWLEQRGVRIPIFPLGQGVEKTIARDCDFFTDDDLEKLLPLNTHVPHLYLFSWPYNLHEILPEGIKRLGGWKDLLEKVSR